MRRTKSGCRVSILDLRIETFASHYKQGQKMDRQRWLEGTLYSPDFEQDSCGFGLIAQLDDKPSHWLVNTAISS